MAKSTQYRPGTHPVHDETDGDDAAAIATFNLTTFSLAPKALNISLNQLLRRFLSSNAITRDEVIDRHSPVPTDFPELVSAERVCSNAWYYREQGLVPPVN